MDAPLPPELPERIPLPPDTTLPPGIADVPVPPVPLPLQVSDRWKGFYWAPSTYLRGHLFMHAAVFLLVAGSMWFQPERYSVHNLQGLYFLVRWLTPREWALAFLVVAVLKLVAGFHYPHWSVAAIICGIILITIWAIGFAFAWLYDHATVIGFAAFILLLGEHFVATTMLDGRLRWRAESSE